MRWDGSYRARQTHGWIMNITAGSLHYAKIYFQIYPLPKRIFIKKLIWLSVYQIGGGNASIFVGSPLLLCYYSNNTPEIHRKEFSIPFILCKRAFKYTKERQHQFPVVKREAYSLFFLKAQGYYSCSHPAQFLSGEIILSKQKSYGLMSFVLVYNMSFQWDIFQSWQRLQNEA